MSLHQAPAEGALPTGTPLHFSSVNTERRERWYGWLAGRAHWYVCHKIRPTKPCLEEVTKGAVTCPWCELLLEKEVIGYVPFYRETDSKPVHTRVRDYQRSEIDKIGLHTRCQISRGPRGDDVVGIVVTTAQTPKFVTASPEKMAYCDITVSLLKLWKLPALNEWYAKTHGVRVVPRQSAVEQETTITRPDGSQIINAVALGTMIDKDIARRERTLRNEKQVRQWLAEKEEHDQNGNSKHKRE